ncbi:MAG: type I pantothenate kinase [Acidimicrobiales bacterium]
MADPASEPNSGDRWGERIFDRPSWAALRAHESVPISESDLDALAGINENLSMAEVEEVYVPLARLVHLRAGVTRSLHDATGAFLGRFRPHVPFVLGVAGSVAVGKSTTSRVLQRLLSRAPERRRVDLVTTDGFLLPNADLRRRGLLQRKGFPESYDTGSLVRFLSDLKAGKPGLSVPVYSHVVYDVVAGERQTVDRPDIVIVEGLNVLQVPPTSGPGGPAGHPSVFVSDFFDFSVYVDAEEEDIEDWYLRRFLTLIETARSDEGAFFHRFRTLSTTEAEDLAREIWTGVNRPNLHDNVLPTRDRADLVLEKGADHTVRQVRLRLR